MSHQKFAGCLEGFQFTVTDLNDPRISDLKLAMKIRNAYKKALELEGKVTDFYEQGRRYRVRVRGRLGKNNPNRHLYASGRGKIKPRGPLYRWTSQDIRPEHATRFDVYVHRYYAK